MLIFGHTGVTIGVARLVAVLTARWPSLSGERVGSLPQTGAADPPLRKGSFLLLSRWLDYRLLAVAGMLPDLIDKPVGLLLFPHAISTGRIYAHSLLFALIIGAVGLYLFRRRGQAWLFILALGSLAHLLEDRLWGHPQILFWPFLGLHYPHYPVDNWPAQLIHGLFNSPLVYGMELTGLLLLVYLGIEVLWRKRFTQFVRTGYVP